MCSLLSECWRRIAAPSCSASSSISCWRCSWWWCWLNCQNFSQPQPPWVWVPGETGCKVENLRMGMFGRRWSSAGLNFASSWGDLQHSLLGTMWSLSLSHSIVTQNPAQLVTYCHTDLKDRIIRIFPKTSMKQAFIILVKFNLSSFGLFLNFQQLTHIVSRFVSQLHLSECFSPSSKLY